MSGSERVWMHHDELDRTRQFARSQVPFMGAAGWHEVDPPEPEPEKPKPAKDSKPSRRARPRATSEKEND